LIGGLHPTPGHFFMKIWMRERLGYDEKWRIPIAPEISILSKFQN
jgi:hypothetical protein